MPDPADTLYTGEPAPRRRWLGLLLTLLMPGLGHVYAGAFAGGLLRYLAGLFGGLLFLLAWRAFLFQPHLPLAVLALTYVIYLFVLLREVWQRTGPATRDYVLQGFNHPVIYGSLLILCHALPAALLGDRISKDVVGATQVQDGAMFPMLFIGDEVLLDRTAYRARPPRRGDLVAMRVKGTREVMIRRVIAAPRDTVSFEGRQVIVNAMPLEREELGDLSLSGVDNRGEPRGMHLAGWRERNGRASYVVTHRPDRERASPGPAVIPDGQFFVMSDNRDSGPDSRDFGLVAHDGLIGRPLYVWWSRRPDRDQETVWARIGLGAR